MKLKTISRLEGDYTKDCKGDRLKVHRNMDPAVHPFEKAREYTRALTAVKMDKIFAKPLVGQLDGHTDGVFCSTTSSQSLVQFISGACDGEVRVWDMGTRKTVWSVAAHQGFVRGLTVAPDGYSFFSAGDDGVVKQWDLSVGSGKGHDAAPPMNVWRGKTGGFKALHHHYADPQFATAGNGVQVWDEHRAQPTLKFDWGADTVNCVQFNPAERGLLVSTGSDRNICLYDTRQASPLRKVILQMRSNKAVWNPQEPMNFVVANEDHNLYTFDMRNLSQSLMIHKDHVSAVMDVAFSPTGQEFVSGSYDRSVRLFSHRSGRSRDVYHSKRMQRIFCVNFSADARFVVCGSDETNLRVWKAKASEKLGSIIPRERRASVYREGLKKRYAHMPEVRKIAKHQHVPKAIKKAKYLEKVQDEKVRRKRDNVKKHSKKGALPYVGERKRKVVKEVT